MIAGLAFIIGAFVVYINLIRPLNDETQDVKAQVFGKETLIANQKKNIDKIKALIATYNQAENKEAIASALPIKQDDAGVLAQLKGIIENSGLVVQSLSFSGPGAKISVETNASRTATSTQGLTRALGTVRVQAQLAGTYEGLKKFLGNLESNVRIFDLESLSFAASGDQGSRNVYNFSVTVVTYYQN